MSKERKYVPMGQVKVPTIEPNWPVLLQPKPAPPAGPTGLEGYTLTQADKDSIKLQELTHRLRSEASRRSSR